LAPAEGAEAGQQIEFETGLEIDSMLGTLELVRNSDWATIVASIVVMDEMNKGTLVAQPIYGPELWLDFFLKRTKNVPLSRACQEFLDWLRATLVRVVKTQGPSRQVQIA